MNDPNYKTLSHGGLSAAMMAALCYRPKGAPRFGTAQGLGIVFAIGAGLVEAFYPNPAETDPDPVATEKDLQNALNGMAKGVIDQEWWDQVQKMQASELANLTGFFNICDDLFHNLSIDPNGKLAMAGQTDKQIETSVQGKYDYLNPFKPTSLLQVLREARYRLETSSLNDTSLTSQQVAAHQSLTLGLYGLIGSLTTAYLNASIGWSWGRELQMTAEYNQYQLDVQKWNAGGQQGPSPENDYPEVNVASGYTPSTWDEFKAIPGSVVEILVKEVQAMVDFCAKLPDAKPGLDFDTHALDNKIAAFDVPVPKKGITKDGMTRAIAQGAARSEAWFFESLFDTAMAAYDVSVPAAGIGKVDMVRAMEQGAARSGAWSARGTDDLLQRAVEVWKAISSSVQFTVYTVKQGGEYLANIARDHYGSDAWESHLFQANSDILAAPGLVPGGTLLKIPGLDALSYGLIPARVGIGV